jgi:hypothetical protein
MKHEEKRKKKKMLGQKPEVYVYFYFWSLPLKVYLIYSGIPGPSIYKIGIS